MAHDHPHGESSSEYYVEQLFTILVCGALGVVAVEMYRRNMLGIVLAEQFHIPALLGGIGLLVIVAFRAVAVWREAGANHHDHGHAHDHHHDHGHDHDHAHDHNHDHGHDHHHHEHDHSHAHDDHGHSHDLSWTFARLLVLAFPVALFLLGLPNQGLSEEYIKRLLGKDVSLGAVDFNDLKVGDATEPSFNELNGAAYDPDKRAAFQGKTVRLKGMIDKIGDKEFRLYRLKMTCCASDTIPLKVRLVTRYALSGVKDGEWVDVKGQVQFNKVDSGGRTAYIPVIKVAELSDIVKVPPNATPYE